MSYTFNTQPIVASAKKKDPCKDAANAVLRHCTPLSSRERGASTAAVDGDRVSQFALKWAADHILSRRHCFFLVLAHVRRKHTSLHAHGGKQFAISHMQDDVPAACPAACFHAQMDLQAKDLMLPFQCFCSRRGMCAKLLSILLSISVPSTLTWLSFQRSSLRATVPTRSATANPGFPCVVAALQGLDGKYALAKTDLSQNSVNQT